MFKVRKLLILSSWVLTVMWLGNAPVFAADFTPEDMKSVLSTCDINKWFAVGSAITDSSNEAKQKLVNILIERTIAQGKCDAYEALLGLELLRHYASPAISDLIKIALIKAREPDGGKAAPRFDDIQRVLGQIISSDPNGKFTYLGVFRKLKIEEQVLLLIPMPQIGFFDESGGQAWQRAISWNLDWDGHQGSASQIDKQIHDAQMYAPAALTRIYSNIPAEVINAFSKAFERRGNDPLLRYRILLELARVGQLGPLLPKALNLVNDKETPISRRVALGQLLQKTIALDLTSLYHEMPSIMQVDCSIEKIKFKLDFRGTESNDDPDGATLWFVGKKFSPAVFAASGCYGFSRSGSGPCKGIASVAITPEIAVVLLLEDNRPFNYVSRVVFYDAKKERLIAVTPVLGETDDPIQFQSVPGGVSVRVQPQPGDSAECSGVDCPLVRGQKSDSIGEEPLPFWVRVELDNGDVRRSLDLELTWEKSPVRSFFKTRDEFEKAFGLGLDAEGPQRPWIRMAIINGKMRCIYPSETRDLPNADDAWICRGL